MFHALPVSIFHVQATETWFVALVNDTADESAKMLTAKYSIAEVAYFRSLVRRRPTPQRLFLSDQNHLLSGLPVEAVPSLRTSSIANGSKQCSCLGAEHSMKQRTQRTPYYCSPWPLVWWQGDEPSPPAAGGDAGGQRGV